MKVGKVYKISDLYTSMAKRDRFLKVVAYIMLFVALIHGFAHIVVFETNLSLVNTIGLSGFAIGDVESQEFEKNIKQNEQAPKSSLYILGAEWISLISLILLSVMRSHLAIKAQNNQHVEILRKKSKSETDIDLLYQMLQKNKKISVTKISQIFNVDKEIVLEWGEVLENNNLAIVDYPRFGEIEMRVKE